LAPTVIVFSSAFGRIKGHYNNIDTSARDCSTEIVYHNLQLLRLEMILMILKSFSSNEKYEYYEKKCVFYYIFITRWATADSSDTWSAFHRGDGHGKTSKWLRFHTTKKPFTFNGTSGRLSPLGPLGPPAICAYGLTGKLACARDTPYQRAAAATLSEVWLFDDIMTVASRKVDYSGNQFKTAARVCRVWWTLKLRKI